MAIHSAMIAETGAAALLFAATFLWGGRAHPFRRLVRDERTVGSFGAGVAIAYVFVHLMPELHDARRAFAESASTPLRYEGMGIYYLALIGFMVFYGLDHLRRRWREPGDQGEAGSSFRIHIGGYSAYVALMAYLLVHQLEDTATSTALFAVAIAIHFLGVDNALREEHGAAYERTGRYLLAAMSLFGWGVGQLLVLPHTVLALLVAFISGAVIMNSSIMELPSEKDGRFLPFLCGGLVYGLILLPLG
jgi:hypothetical protein